MAGSIRVNAITLQGEFGIILLGAIDLGPHLGVEICDVPTLLALIDQPFGVSDHHLIVVKAILAMIVINGRRQMHDFRPALLARIAQAQDSIAKRLESRSIQWLINPAVDAVAGDDEIGFGLGDDSLQSFVQIGSGKLTACVV